MAIKGKGRTRSRRMVAAPPRPQLVTRKKPLLFRVTTWIVVGCLVLVAVGWGGWVWWEHKQASDLKAREQAAVTTLAQRVTDQLPADRSTPQGTSQVAVFPSIVTTLDQIDQGKLSKKRATAAAKSVADQASKAASGIGNISLQSILKEDFNVGVTADLTAPGMTSSVMNVAQAQMVEGLQLYRTVGRLMLASLDLPQGPKRSAIITEARSQAQIAAGIFTQGYNTMVQIESQLDLIQNSGLKPPTAG